MKPLQAGRRDLSLTPLVDTLPTTLMQPIWAGPLDPAQTIIRPPAEHVSNQTAGYPERSVGMCPRTGETTKPRLYYTLVR